MLVLKKLLIEGFGPFADPQDVSLAPSGITVIYGDNMRGKTSLLNAIRYAFFGIVRGRGSRTRALHTLSNRDLAATGEYGFSVALSFTHGGETFELTRECRPKGDSPPSSDKDYAETRRLRRSDGVLGPQETEQLLPTLFPEDVSRFFLFDGELLQEYEELLYDDSLAGRRISESIERILGVPLLKDARAHVAFVLEEAEKAAGKEASRFEETRSIGNALEQATELRASQRAELVRLEEQLAMLQAERQDAERYLESVAKYRVLIADREVIRQELSEVEPRLATIADEIRTSMRDAWKTVLAEPVRAARDDARREAEQSLDSVVEGLRRRAIKTGVCEVCEQRIGDEARSKLGSEVGGPAPNGDDGLTLGISEGLRRLTELEKFKERDVGELVRRLEEERRTLAIRRVDLTDRIAEIETELGDADTDDIESEGKSLREVEQKIGVVARGIGEQQDAISKLDQNIERLSRKLEEIGTTDLKSSQERSKLLRQVSDVLVRSIEDYKTKLRKRVERSATELFLQMTTEKSEYKALEINESYGLDILHADGRREIGRSAGAEHVVALALMGALQQNAPLRGPVVMDSPFGRLDPSHTSNVVKALPSIAEQVVLLIQEGEVPRSQIRELLGGHLAMEYELEKISARRTNIRPVKA